jgi:hypothetical protein
MRKIDMVRMMAIIVSARRTINKLFRRPKNLFSLKV